MIFRILWERIADALRVLRGENTRRANCLVCHKSFYWNLGFWVPYGKEGAVTAFCVPCFRKEPTEKLARAFVYAAFEIQKYLIHPDTNILPDARKALEYFKGDMSGNPPFENPYFKKRRTIWEFPDDPIAEAIQLKITTVSV